VNEIVFDVVGKVTSNGSWFRFEGVGRTHELPDDFNGLLPFHYQHHAGTGQDESDERIVESFPFVAKILSLSLFEADPKHFETRYFKTFFLEALDDLSRKAPLYGVWFDHDKRSLMAHA
jgi:hypothetical protein